MTIHDDEEVHIAIRARLPISMRAKKDNLLRVKLLDQPPLDIFQTLFEMGIHKDYLLNIV
jgi:hypothetical protein